MNYILWGYHADAREIYDRLPVKPAYFIDDKESSIGLNYKGCPVYPVSKYTEDENKKYIYVTSIEHYTKIRTRLESRGLKEGLDFSGAFEYLDLRKRFSTGPFKKRTWEEKNELYSLWNHRVQQMAQYIDVKDHSVMDLGCGNAYLKEVLQDQGITYLGCDFVPRTNASYLCDFNRYEFPEVSVDVLFVSGCMEYIKTSEWLIQQICHWAPKIILSYLPLEYLPNILRRRSFGYNNDYSIRQLIVAVEKHGFKLTASQHSFTNDFIFVFKKIA